MGSTVNQFNKTYIPSSAFIVTNQLHGLTTCQSWEGNQPGIELANFKWFVKNQGAKSTKACHRCKSLWDSGTVFVIFLAFHKSIKTIKEGVVLKSVQQLLAIIFFLAGWKLQNLTNNYSYHTVKKSGNHYAILVKNVLLAQEILILLFWSMIGGKTFSGKTELESHCN